MIPSGRYLASLLLAGYLPYLEENKIFESYNNSNAFLINYPALNFNYLIQSKVSCAKRPSCAETVFAEGHKSNTKRSKKWRD